MTFHDRKVPQKVAFRKGNGTLCFREVSLGVRWNIVPFGQIYIIKAVLQWLYCFYTFNYIIDLIIFLDLRKFWKNSYRFRQNVYNELWVNCWLLLHNLTPKDTSAGEISKCANFKLVNRATPRMILGESDSFDSPLANIFLDSCIYIYIIYVYINIHAHTRCLFICFSHTFPWFFLHFSRHRKPRSADFRVMLSWGQKRRHHCETWGKVFCRFFCWVPKPRNF